MNYVNSLITNDNITMVFDDVIKTCPKTNPNYDKVKSLILKGKPMEALAAFDITSRLKQHSSGQFFVGEDGIVYMDKNKPVPMPVALSKRVVQFADANLDFQPLVNFWYNVQANPNSESIKDLYGFLEHNGIAVTEDGCFCAYKGVNGDYTSTKPGVWEYDSATANYVKNDSKHYDNHPGNFVSMPRVKVDSNREVTCSSGLHVAAFKYASGFAQKLILVKVNPADVVSVPTDYNQEKMRTCGYLVLEDVTEELKTPLYGQAEKDWDNTVDDGSDDWDDDTAEEQEDIDDIEAEDLDEEDDMECYLKPDKSGRVCIPSALVKKMGLTPGDIAYVYVDTGRIAITGTSTSNDIADNDIADFKYVVDRDSNVRLSKGCVEASGIMNAHNYIIANCYTDEDEIVLSWV